MECWIPGLGFTGVVLALALRRSKPATSYRINYRELLRRIVISVRGIPIS
jgi:hypothetical protein